MGKPPDRVQVEGQQRVLNFVLRRDIGTFDPLASENEGNTLEEAAEEARDDEARARGARSGMG